MTIEKHKSIIFVMFVCLYFCQSCIHTNVKNYKGVIIKIEHSDFLGKYIITTKDCIIMTTDDHKYNIGDTIVVK